MSNSISSATVQPNVFRSVTAPTKGQIGDIWMDTGVDPPNFMVCTSISPLVWTDYSGGAGGQASIQFKDEGGNLGSSGTVDTIDFVGAGVVASRVSNALTVTISGGAPGGGSTFWEMTKWSVD